MPRIKNEIIPTKNKVKDNNKLKVVDPTLDVVIEKDNVSLNQMEKSLTTTTSKKKNTQIPKKVISIEQPLVEENFNRKLPEVKINKVKKSNIKTDVQIKVVTKTKRVLESDAKLSKVKKSENKPITGQQPETPRKIIVLKRHSEIPNPKEIEETKIEVIDEIKTKKANPPSKKANKQVVADLQVSKADLPIKSEIKNVIPKVEKVISEESTKKIAQTSKKSEKKQNDIPQKEKKKHIPKSIPIQLINEKCLFSKDDLKNKQVSDLLMRFKNNLERNFDLSLGSKILVAVSGGVDSVVLLDLLANLNKEKKFFLLICHFNHKLRAFSADIDEKFVKDLAKNYGIKFYTDSSNVKDFAEKNSQSIEQAARTLRYTFFERLAKSMDIPYIALAHNADDSAETFIINLMRGTGLTGLSGIPEQRTVSKKSQIIRPLLKFKKVDLLNYAKQRNLKWHEDETNSLLLYTRNKIRLDLIPKLQNEFNESIIETINRTSSLIRSADAFIKDHLDIYMKFVKWDKKSELLTIRISLLKTCDEYIQGEIIQKSLEEHFHSRNLSLKVIERIINLTDQSIGSIVEINKKISVLRDRLNLVFYSRKEETETYLEIEKTGEHKIHNFTLKMTEVNKRDIKFSNDKNIEFIDIDLLPVKLVLRNWNPGDNFIPLGMDGSVKISDFLVNNKISLLDKKNIILLSTKTEIIWVCGLRINDKYKVNQMTTRYLKLELIKD
jgi:tRNA(Ile)-lysidine synthase